MPTQSSEFNNPEIAPSKIIGASLPRIDGPLKTTGSARYASDYNFANMVYAVPVCATIANGKIRSLDTSAAEKMPGVLLVLHHHNIGPLFRFFGQGRNSEGRPPLEDNVISYWGQYVALAVAETLQQAQAAAGGRAGTVRRGAAERLHRARKRDRNRAHREQARRSRFRIHVRAGAAG